MAGHRQLRQALGRGLNVRHAGLICHRGLALNGVPPDRRLWMSDPAARATRRSERAKLALVTLSRTPRPSPRPIQRLAAAAPFGRPAPGSPELSRSKNRHSCSGVVTRVGSHARARSTRARTAPGVIMVWRLNEWGLCHGMQITTISRLRSRLRSRWNVSSEVVKRLGRRSHLTQAVEVCRASALAILPSSATPIACVDAGPSRSPIGDA
jgi:hypothetical protein